MLQPELLKSFNRWRKTLLRTIKHYYAALLTEDTYHVIFSDISSIEKLLREYLIPQETTLCVHQDKYWFISNDGRKTNSFKLDIITGEVSLDLELHQGDTHVYVLRCTGVKDMLFWTEVLLSGGIFTVSPQDIVQTIVSQVITTYKPCEVHQPLIRDIVQKVLHEFCLYDVIYLDLYTERVLTYLDFLKYKNVMITRAYDTWQNKNITPEDAVCRTILQYECCTDDCHGICTCPDIKNDILTAIMTETE